MIRFIRIFKKKVPVLWYVFFNFVKKKFKKIYLTLINFISFRITNKLTCFQSIIYKIHEIRMQQQNLFKNIIPIKLINLLTSPYPLTDSIHYSSLKSTHPSHRPYVIPITVSIFLPLKIFIAISPHNYF